MTDIINGILAGLEDFIECRFKHFKNDEELEEYLMGLPESMRTNLEASLIALLFSSSR